MHSGNSTRATRRSDPPLAAARLLDSVEPIRRRIMLFAVIAEERRLIPFPFTAPAAPAVQVRSPSLALRGGMLLVLALAGCDRDELAARDEPTSPSQITSPDVTTAPVRLAAWPRVLQVPGSLQVDERSTLGSKVTGRLAEMLVDVGSEVVAGAVLARVEPTDYQVRVEQAEAMVRQTRALLGLDADGDDRRVDPEDTAAVREARAVLEEALARRDRAIALRTQGITPEAEIDVVAAAARVAEARTHGALQSVRNLVGQLDQRLAELTIARQQLQSTEIRAPYAGVIVERLAGRGDFLSSGSPVVAMVKIDPLRLQLEIPERDSHRVRLDQPLRFWLEGDEQPHAATITRLPPELNPRSRSLLAEAGVANPAVDGMRALRAGAFARVELVLDADATTLVAPATALRSFAGVERVVVVIDGIAHERLVTVGRRDTERIEILDGATAGELVIENPGSIGEGRRVRVRE